MKKYKKHTLSKQFLDRKDDYAGVYIELHKTVVNEKVLKNKFHEGWPVMFRPLLL